MPGRLLLLVVSLLVVLAIFGGGIVLLQKMLRFDSGAPRQPVPAEQGCVATASGRSAFVTLEQSKWASVIVAESIRRNLPPRAATIALATAMQESGLRNINYGDRDSIGLFQQRPSQDWGSVQQIMDPWYSSGKFYEALVKVPNWQTGDINDIAQRVQRSGVPEGYRKHVEDAQVLASVLSGHSPAGLSCVRRDSAAPEPSRHQEILTRALRGKITVARQGTALVITGRDETTTWAAAHLMMANLRDAGVTAAEVGPAGQGQRWTLDPQKVASWQGSPPPGSRRATITLG